MKKNDIVTLNITGITSEGQGVGRIGNMVIFVPFSAVGDVLEVLIVSVKKNYCYGKILNIKTKSKYRTENACEVFGKCGGCVYRHISYESELESKQQVVENNIQRIGGYKNFKVEKIVSIPKKADGYRNKAQYPVSKNGKNIEIGFYSQRSHRVNECLNCALQPKEFENILKLIKQFLIQFNISIYNETTQKGLLRHIYLRKAEKTNQIMVVLVINSETFPNINILVDELKSLLGSSLKSVQLNINKNNTNVVLGEKCVTVFGNSYIEDSICNTKFRISPLSFYQVNRDMAEKLYIKAKEYANPKGKTVVDLYCGAGTIGLSMAKEAKKVIGVEIVPQAVEDAYFNKKLNNITNAEFICADATEAVKLLNEKSIKPNVVILDPPRKGCTEELLNTVANGFKPERIVYVSCDSATLARDCKILNSLGYTLKKATPHDLFPRTMHVETVCLLSKKEK